MPGGLGDEGGDVVVLHRGDAGEQAGFDVVVLLARRGGDDLGLDAHAGHVGAAGGEIVEAGAEGGSCWAASAAALPGDMSRL